MITSATDNLSQGPNKILEGKGSFENAMDPFGRNLFPNRSIRKTRSINSVKAIQPVPVTTI